MSVTLIGSFIFSAEGYGILTGIYHNTGDTVPFSETAKWDGKSSRDPSDLFVGNYRSVWLEENRHDKSILEITLRADQTYKLKWRTAAQIHYVGIGFLKNNQLIGCYWQYSMQSEFNLYETTGKVS